MTVPSNQMKLTSTDVLRATSLAGCAHQSEH
jgi:hypothetical protein